MLQIIHHEHYLTPYFTSVAESPHRIKAIINKLKDEYETVVPEPAATADILRVHDPLHLLKVRAEGKDTYETALLAAGGALRAGALAMSGIPAFAVVRPPGHHAGRNRYGGFCFFNNVAVAVARLLDSGEVGKAAIIDIDMHHGDGTQDIFAQKPSVSVINLWARDRGTYLDLLRQEIDRIPPVDVIAVSAGFDLYVRDWGGLLETSDFREIGLLIHRAATEKASGRCFAVLEGGYFVEDLGKNVLAFCRGLEGK